MGVWGGEAPPEANLSTQNLRGSEVRGHGGEGSPRLDGPRRTSVREIHVRAQPRTGQWAWRGRVAGPKRAGSYLPIGGACCSRGGVSLHIQQAAGQWAGLGRGAEAGGALLRPWNGIPPGSGAGYGAQYPGHNPRPPIPGPRQTELPPPPPEQQQHSGIRAQPGPREAGAPEP